MREKNRDALSRKLEIEQQEAFMTLEQEQQVKTRTAEQNAKIAALRPSVVGKQSRREFWLNDRFRKRKSTANRPSVPEKLKLNVKFALKRSNSSRSPKSPTRRNRSLLPPNRNNSRAEARANLALAEAVSAQQNVETTRQTAEADRAKQVALIAAAQDAETKAVELTVRAKAEKEAAEMQAAAIVELAEATRKRVWRKQKHNVR